MANVAVINGSSRGLGLAFSRYLLSNTSLNVVSTSSRDASKARKAILEDSSIKEEDVKDRLTTLDLDVTDERSIENAAKQVKERFGGGNLRLLINVAGILHPEKSIQKVNYDDLLETFKINTFGHMMTFKHFVPLLPGKSKEHDYSNDPAKGLIKPNLSVLASMTARIGSIGDNNSLGGWYSYRTSKAATNQLIKTLNLELARASGAGGTTSKSDRASNDAIAVALHPGTLLGTDLSKPFVDPSKNDKDTKEKEGKKGVHEPSVGAEMLMQVLKGLDKGQGGKFFDYAGKEIPW
ncbi:NAD(P)-binding protein [Cystobasidium minutum MCA 4210]|uniref:NAD(P)-binding protein n=1 Tax=Cystobasidium minutum MCA 4210 TaxID=1397322 RepID=UPI0034CFCF07|eukprot:jgi/Rhomi1/81919/CE81918_399